MSLIRRLTRVAVGLPLVAVGIVTVVIVASGSHRRLGATPEEAAARLPGDELLERADLQADRAVTIAAPPDRVWPWIAQLGQDKAGFYSFEWLENLVGCDIRNAERIVPAWQNPQVGDAFPLHPDMVLTVARVDPGRALVATSMSGVAPQNPGMDFSWAFTIDSLPRRPGGQRGHPAPRPRALPCRGAGSPRGPGGGEPHQHRDELAHAPEHQETR